MTVDIRASWQQVSGRIEPGELGWQAALREIREETGLVPTPFYSADQTEFFYEHRQNCINVAPDDRVDRGAMCPRQGCRLPSH